MSQQTPEFTKLIKHLRLRAADPDFMNVSTDPYVDSDGDYTVPPLHMTDGLTKDELALGLISACMVGDLPVAQAIWREAGPFEMSFQREKYQNSVNGQAIGRLVKTDLYFGSAVNTERLAELFEWMPTVGLGFLCGVNAEGSMLLDSNYIGDALRMARTDPFDGALPSLVQGRVDQPELLMALAVKRDQSAYKESYDEIMCWATPEMVKAFPEHLAAFKSDQTLDYKTWPAPSNISHPLEQTHLANLTDDFIERVRSVPGYLYSPAEEDNSISFIELKLRTIGVGDRLDIIDMILLKRFLTEPLQHGFDYPAGKVLCRTTVDFLQQFEMGETKLDNLEKSERFCTGYFPMDIILFKNDKHTYADARSVEFNIGLKTTGFNDFAGINKLFKMLRNDHPLQSRIRDAIPLKLWEFLAGTVMSYPMAYDALIGMHQGLGFDNKKVSVRLTLETLEILYKTGFVFAEGSKCFFAEKDMNSARLSSDKSPVCLDLPGSLVKSTGPDSAARHANAFKLAIEMNLWPAEEEAPTGLDEALKMAGRKKNWGSLPSGNAKKGSVGSKKDLANYAYENALKAYIEHAGIEACVAVAKSVTQWQGIANLFETDVIRPYLKQSPSAFRGKLLENALGM
jgi:hypothetical protein